MTQAMTVYDMLVEQGHTVSAVILGSSGARDIPAFFFEKVKAPIIQVQSPNFVTDKKNKSINVTKSVIHNFKKIETFKQSLRTIDALMKEHEPDVVINFFDLLIGLYYRFYKPKAKMICVAHQYIYFHPDFEFPAGRWIDKASIKFFTKLTATGSSKNLALSFYKIHTTNEDVVVVPPLLRKEIFELETKHDDFYLVYSYATRSDDLHFTSLVVNKLNELFGLGDHIYNEMRQVYSEYTEEARPPYIDRFYPFQGGVPMARYSDDYVRSESGILLKEQAPIQQPAARLRLIVNH
jgi:hypothetical protein